MINMTTVTKMQEMKLGTMATVFQNQMADLPEITQNYAINTSDGLWYCYLGNVDMDMIREDEIKQSKYDPNVRKQIDRFMD